jgi:hypothetical protein
VRIEYVPMPPPQDIEGISPYLQNELQRIARFLGGLSEIHDSGMFLSTEGATMALTTTPATITAYDTVREDEEGLIADKDAGTFTFLSDSRYRLNFSANMGHHSGGQTDTTIGVYINDVLQAGTEHTLNFNGSHYLPISFAAKGIAQAGDVVEIKMAMDSGTSTVTFNILDVDIEGKAIDV